MLVGDLLIGCRELIPDLPQTYPAPFIISATPIPTFTGPLPVNSGPWTVVLTAVNAWGETIGSNAITGIMLGAGQTDILVTYSAAGPGGTHIRAYLTSGSSGIAAIYDYPSALGNTIDFVVGTLLGNANPPTRNTAWLPDTNGRFASVGTLYRWLNEALLAASSIAEGLPNTSGIPAVAGQGQYYVPGQWKKFWNGWFNGIPFAWGGSKDMFYRNVLSGYTFLAIVQNMADRITLELQPQPNETGGQTTLSSPLNVGDTAINLTSAAGIIMPLGVAQVGSEIIVYSSVSGAQLAGCSRGMGGTTEVNWPAGTIVKECNIRFNGQILFTSPFTVGQALNNVPVPADWYIPIRDYMLNLAKQGEKSAADYQAKLKEFSAFVKMSCKGNQTPAGPRQVGGTSYPGDSYPSRGGFGIIVP